MENFKSFGKKLTVPFFPGFTAVTGPNGAGKSNIVDAILFVLGPKSSKVMRAGRLTDLIFNGGKKRKNPAKFCKVSLVFDNSSRKMPVEADEVVLTRMIKRAPLKNDPTNYYSYYYINGRGATFSEFVDVLTHARISGDGYNIIKQGDVTSLVKMGSVERRKIIDDVAGISSFDEDIKKAEKEQNDVERNLERIKIILNEINSQTRQLKKDRDAAHRFKELKDKLYENKAKITHKKKQEIQQQISEVHRQIESYEKEQQAFEKNKVELKNQYDLFVKELDEIEKKISDLGGDEAKTIGKEIETIRTEDIKIEEKINYLNNEILECKNEKKELDSILSKINKELEELQIQQRKLEEEKKDTQQKLGEKEEELSNSKEEIDNSDEVSIQLTRELVKMREEYDEKLSGIHELKLKRDRIDESMEALKLQIAEIQETKSTYEFELKDINWHSSEMQKDVQVENKKIKDIEKNLFEKRKKQAQLTENLTDLEKIIVKLQREKSKLQAEYDALESVHAQYNQAVNAILKARDSGELNGICGTIAELAHVDEQYKNSLEIAAGVRMQSIVVENDSTAADAIKLLTNKKIGRATFLPLNKMEIGKPRAKALLAVKDEKSHGFAFDIVKFNEKYKSAFWYVFGDTVIVDTLSDARRLMGGVRLVDLNGNLIEAGGAIIGGSLPKTHFTFGAVDRNKLDELISRLNEAIKNQDNITDELGELKKEISDMEGNLSSLKTEKDSNIQIKDLDLRKKEFLGKINIISKDLDSKLNEKNNLINQKKELESKISEFESRLEELNLQKHEKGKHLLKTSKKEIVSEFKTLEEEVGGFKENILKINSECETLQKKIEIISERKDDIFSKIEAVDYKIEELKSSLKNYKESRTKYKDNLKALMNVEEQMTGKVKEFTFKRDEIYKKTVGIENELDKISTKLESYLDLISRSKYRLPILEDAIRELDQEIALYGVEIKDKKLPNIESLKETVRVIEESMNEFEPVNMRALEEYDHQMERKKKFDEDVAHLKNQEKNLIKLVNEITKKKKDRFFEVYDEINKNFKQIYSKLSEGGEAELLIENEEQLFDSGLSIKARPHGKKVLYLNALSGGEKSIASLAFIFSIQQYDPSPFYVLDEVDMFLDGVNAETVSRMIKDNARYSQFINVSLRKIVLKEANHVYGVTMHDSGISEMIGNIDPEAIGPKGEIFTKTGVSS